MPPVVRHRNYMDPFMQPGGPHDQLFNGDVLEGTGIGTYDEEPDRSRRPSGASMHTPPSSPPSSPPLSFAPRGTVTARNIRNRLSIHIPKVANDVQKVVNKTVDSRKAKKFLEVLKHTITTSRLLTPEPSFGPLTGVSLPIIVPGAIDENNIYSSPWSANGAIVAAALGLGFACLCRWFFVGGVLRITLWRAIVAAVLVLLVVLITRVYMRRQWLEYITEQTAAQANAFSQLSEEFDSAAGAACNFIMEVELIARGYRISLPLPPVSRFEDQTVANGQSLKSVKTRKALLHELKHAGVTFHGMAEKIRELSNEDELMQLDAFYGFSKTMVEEALESLQQCDPEQPWKTYEIREFHHVVQELRKMMLLGLIAIDGKSTEAEFFTFTLALESLRRANEVTRTACCNIKKMLLNDETFANITSPKLPQTPEHKNWRMQVRKIGSMNMSIRSLQAKMALLAEESTEIISTSDDLSGLGTMFMAQYETIGKDLRALMDEWEAGKAGLSVGMNKAERRVSSRSFIMSPISSSEMASVSEEGGREDALKALNGGSSPPSSVDPSSPVSLPQPEIVFEAIALQEKPRSLMSRAERIAKVKADREARETAKERPPINGYVLGELKNVLDNRKKARQSMPNLTRTPAV
ncbi:Mysoin-binding motif of peroxisomes-domain-containing protein [Pseudomassariella vexata]|uniref:Mysoin-binding motif of peroxisomes-domain-containing protein n=1 Tax=Pseudomassariella vexata TaxID=1141098 RepID=A0A1Y2DSD9_9PEZI|nr:Mysoin-binding motif of peroxisomes-domain-containing protein [Pseudomassariella vexata]ORY62187.1 Mysoin-binding motif of peroxisomes-domain-containing protein [Pseudomassariella vexata]